MAFASAIYRGKIRHRRYREKNHAFSYNIFMMYLDLDELEDVFSLSPFWSLTRWAPARFKRSDYMGGDIGGEAGATVKPVYQCVQEFIQQKTGQPYNGKVRLLSNVRYFSYIINPISNYYCFDESGEQLLYIIAAVTNTPWGETHYYLLENQSGKQNLFSKQFKKDHHVSPLMPMKMDYHWRSNIPGDNIALHLENHENGKLAFDATLALKREEISPSSLNKILVRFPLMTVQTAAGIYWQALKLYLKGIRFFPHPNKHHNTGSKEHYDEA